MWKIIIFTIATGGIIGEHDEQYISKQQCRRAAKKLDSDIKKKERDRLQEWQYTAKVYGSKGPEIADRKRRWAEAEAKYDTLKKSFYEADDMVISECHRRWSSSQAMPDYEKMNECKAHWKTLHTQRLKAWKDFEKSDPYRILAAEIAAIKQAEQVLGGEKPSGKPAKGYKCIKAN